MLNFETATKELSGVFDNGNFICVPLCYQETDYTCGITCVQSLLARYGIFYRQSALSDIMNSKPIIGTDPQSILYFTQLIGLKASMTDNMKIDDLKSYIAAGITPLLIIQAYKEDEIEYTFDWKNSHYILVCGYSENGIYAMDPNVLGNYAYLSYADLMKRWHYADKAGEHHLRTGLIMEYENCPVKYNPLSIKHLD